MTRDKSPAINLGKSSKRNDIINKDDQLKPGPGHYDIGPKKTTSSFTMGKKIEQKDKREVPGPGNYDPASS